MQATMHYFDTKLATKYGMVEAVLLNHLQFWIKHNTEKNINYHEGRYWTFNSVKAFCKLFPYLTEKKIRNAIQKLQDAKILLKGNFNKIGYDRTTWYAFTDFGLHLLCNTEKTEQKDEKVQQDMDIAVEIEQKTETTQRKIQNIMQIPPKTEDVQAYCAQRNNCINVQRFMDYYNANGWYVGKRKMQDWQAAVRCWEQTEKRKGYAGYDSQSQTTLLGWGESPEWKPDFSEPMPNVWEISTGKWD